MSNVLCGAVCGCSVSIVYSSRKLLMLSSCLIYVLDCVVDKLTWDFSEDFHTEALHNRALNE